MPQKTTRAPRLLSWPTQIPKPLSAPPLTLAPSNGPRVINWIERHARHGEGEKFGEQVKLELWQKLFITMLFELKPDGSRRYKRCLLETPKGAGKTPMASWIAAYMLCNQKSPVIPVAAASFEQAGILFDDLRACVSESPTLSQVLTAFENEIQIVGGPGRAYRVAAIAGTNDGQRPTLLVADEIHEWQGPKSRVHLVLSNGCAKRPGSLELNLTTPGVDKDTLAGRLHDYGLRVNSGELADDSFLHVWFGCEPDRFDLDTPEGLRAAIRAANPSADLFVDVEAVAAKYHQVPLAEFARYYLGVWHAGAQAWLPAGAWDACADSNIVVPNGADVVLGFDGSHSNDSTAIVAVTCTPEPHIFTIQVWEKPEGADEWRVPIEAVEDAIRAACKRWRVREVVCDPFRWARSMQILADDGINVVEYPNTTARMTPATQRFYEAILNKTVTHDGSPVLARHVANARLKVNPRGQRLEKETAYSALKIDAAVAACMALDRASVGDPNDYDIMMSIL